MSQECMNLLLLLLLLFFALINIEVIDMTFIDESLMSELCKHFNI